MIDEKKLIEDIRKYFGERIDAMENKEIADNILKLNKDICRIIKKQRQTGDWIPVPEILPEDRSEWNMPEQEEYVLVSFDNFSGVDVARYEEDEEGGVFYPGDDEKSYSSYGLFVNAWMPLPEPYKGE